MGTAIRVAGDPDAFPKLYLLHRKRVFSICLGMVHDFSLAEDLMQETFVRLHRKIASFRGDSLFTTWLHRMTVNLERRALLL
jgi:RNA polymerase sigma-70 factor (ECF subfamily)